MKSKKEKEKSIKEHRFLWGLLTNCLSYPKKKKSHHTRITLSLSAIFWAQSFVNSCTVLCFYVFTWITCIGYFCISTGLLSTRQFSEHKYIRRNLSPSQFRVLYQIRLNQYWFSESKEIECTIKSKINLLSNQYFMIIMTPNSLYKLKFQFLFNSHKNLSPKVYVWRPCYWLILDVDSVVLNCLPPGWTGELGLDGVESSTCLGHNTPDMGNAHRDLRPYVNLIYPKQIAKYKSPYISLHLYVFYILKTQVYWPW